MVMTAAVDIKIGYLCNNHCLHCAIGDLKRDLEMKNTRVDLTTDQVFKILEQQSSIAPVCVLTGGEITIRKDCAQLINKATSLYKLVQIQTNGRRITPKLINSINNLDQCSFAIAVHGPESIHDLITQVKHSYKQTLNGINLLSQTAAETCLKFVLSQYNYKHVDHVIELAQQFNIHRVNIAYVHGCGDARVNLDKLLVSYEQIYPYVTAALEKSEQYGIFTDLETFPMCKIDPRFYTCSDDVHMNSVFCTPVHQQTYNWDIRRTANKKKSEPCKKCFFKNVCEGPWNEYNLSEMQTMHPEKAPLSGDRETVVRKLKLMKALSHDK